VFFHVTVLLAAAALLFCLGDLDLDKLGDGEEDDDDDDDSFLPLLLAVTDLPRTRLISSSSNFILWASSDFSLAFGVLVVAVVPSDSEEEVIGTIPESGNSNVAGGNELARPRPRLFPARPAPRPLAPDMARLIANLAYKAAK